MTKQKPDWVGKARVPFYDYFTLSACAESYTKLMPELVGFAFDYKYLEGDVYYNENDIRQAARWLNADTSRIEKLFRHCKVQVKNLLAASEKHGGQTTKEAFDEWYAVFYEFLPCLGTMLALESALTEKLSFLSHEDFLAVNYSRETSTIEERQSLAKCASLKGKEFEKAVSEHAAKFSWLGNRMLAYHPYSLRDFKSRAFAIKNPQEQLEKLELERKNLYDANQKVIAKLSPEQRKLVEMFQEVLYLRTARAEAVSKAASLTYKLFQATASRLNITRRQLLMLSKEEIDIAFAGKDVSELKKRSRDFSFVLFDGKVKVNWSPALAGDKLKGVLEVKGIVAFRGFARGKVQKVFDVSDMAKFRKGNILVSTYTNPNLLPAMEKAAAIVTDFGGMTSHAAIVSREFGIPCVIGTRNATKIFKDGDEIEVDAVKGVVRKVS